LQKQFSHKVPGRAREAVTSAHTNGEERDVKKNKRTRAARWQEGGDMVTAQHEKGTGRRFRGNKEG